MFPNYKNKCHNSLLQQSNFQEDTVRQCCRNHIVLSAKTASFTTNILAFNSSFSDEFLPKRKNYVLQHVSIWKEKHYAGTMGFIATAESILNAKLYQHYEFTSLIIAWKKNKYSRHYKTSFIWSFYTGCTKTEK